MDGFGGNGPGWKAYLPALAWFAVVFIGIPACSPPPAELVVANGPDVQILDPQKATSAPDGRVLHALFCGLTQLNPESLKPEPALAEAFGQERGGRGWWFQLRPNLRWSDGRPLTGEDVVASWRRLLHPKTGAAYRNWLFPLEGLDPNNLAQQLEQRQDLPGVHLDGLRLEVRFSIPVPAFAEMCAYHALMPVPPSLRQDSPSTQGSWPSSGPYQLQRRVIRDRIRLSANPYYWRAPKPEAKSLDFLTVESQFTALNLFLAGEVHLVATDVPALAVPALLEREEVLRRQAREHGRQPRTAEFDPVPYWACYFYRINVTRTPLQDRKVRQALNLAVDRKALAAMVGARRPPAYSLVPPLIPDYQPPELPRRNPEKARQLLAEAGFPKGENFPPIELLYNSAEIHRDVAESLQAQWQEVLGIEVRLYNQEWKVVLDAQNRLQYDLSRSSWIGDYLDPSTFLEVFRSDSPHNRCGWEDPEYDRLLDQAQLCEQRQPRLALLQQAEQRLLQYGPILPLFYYTTLELVSSDLRGYVRNPRGYVDWAALSLAKSEEP